MTMVEDNNNKRTPTQQATAPSHKQKVVIPDNALGFKITLTSNVLTRRKFSSNSLWRILIARSGRTPRYKRSSRLQGQRKPGRWWLSRCAASRSATTTATERWNLRRFVRIPARNGCKPLLAHVLLVLFSSLKSWKACESPCEALMTLGSALLRLADKRRRSVSLSSSGKAKSCF